MGRRSVSRCIDVAALRRRLFIADAGQGADRVPARIVRRVAVESKCRSAQSSGMTRPNYGEHNFVRGVWNAGHSRTARDPPTCANGVKLQSFASRMQADHTARKHVAPAHVARSATPAFINKRLTVQWRGSTV